MTNAWSLLYDVMEEMNSFSIIPADTKDWEDFWDTLNQQNNDIDLTMDTNNCCLLYTSPSPRDRG